MTEELKSEAQDDFWARLSALRRRLTAMRGSDVTDVTILPLTVTAAELRLLLKAHALTVIVLEEWEFSTRLGVELAESEAVKVRLGALASDPALQSDPQFDPLEPLIEDRGDRSPRAYFDALE